MAHINLIITNAHGTFTDDDVAIINAAGADAEAFISEHFLLDYCVDIVVTAPSFLMSTIPEDGIGGRTYNSRLIMLVIDKKQAAVSHGIIFETICHEMSHSLRWEKLPEYSDNLFKGMVFEGLAVALEEKAVGAKDIPDSQFFLKTVLSTTDEEYQQMMSALKESFESQHYDYETIFFTGNEVLPRWSGYRLGYFYVKKYLESSGRSIEEATLDSYDAFSYK